MVFLGKTPLSWVCVFENTNSPCSLVLHRLLMLSIRRSAGISTTGESARKRPIVFTTLENMNILAVIKAQCPAAADMFGIRSRLWKANKHQVHRAAFSTLPQE
jgi:hypothetical protein